MKFLKYILFFSFLSHWYFLKAQVIVGDNLSTTKKLLKISDNSTKGVVLTNTINWLSFPKLNLNASDLFDDDTYVLKGSILYNKNDDQYYKFDGYAWNPARQTQAIFNSKGSRIGVSTGFTKLCLSFGAGLCFTGNAPIFKKEDNYSDVLIDNLTLKNTLSNFAQVKIAGIYDIAAAVKISGLTLGATAGIKEYKLSLQIRPIGSDNNSWRTIAQKKSYTVILIIEANGADTSFVHTLFIPANSEIRVVPEITSTSADAGQIGGATTDMSSNYSYLSARLIKAL